MRGQDEIRGREAVCSYRLYREFSTQVVGVGDGSERVYHKYLLKFSLNLTAESNGIAR